MKDSFSNRLQKALNINNIKPIDLANKTQLDKSLISNYLAGKYKPGDENKEKIANALGVSEMWLDGYDVDLTGNLNSSSKNNSLDEFEILFDKYKEVLTEHDKEYIKFIIEQRKKEIDKELGEEQ